MARSLAVVLLLVGAFSTPVFAVPPDFVDAELRVGVLAYRGEERAADAWAPTIAYLNQVFPEFSFTLVPLSLSQMHEAVRNGTLSFVITNAGHYVELEAAFGVSRIATLQSGPLGDPEAAIGSVILVRDDRKDIRALKDLKGKTAMSVSRDAFGGFQIAWRELAEAGVDPFKDLSVQFVGFPQDDIVYAVRDGQVDAGIIRTCLLERMSGEGLVRQGDFRVLQQANVGFFPCASTSRLYPDWPFAKLKATPQPVAKRVAQALLAMPPGHPAARAAESIGWTIPVDYQSVHDLFRILETGPYSWLRERSIAAFFERHWQWLVVLLFGIVWFLWHVARVEYLVRQRTAELSVANRRLREEMVERLRAEERAQLQQAELAHVSRVSTMGELAAGLAHELNQPLAAIINYSQGCARRLEAGKIQPQELLEATLRISAQAERAGSIIRGLRNFLRKREVARSDIDVNAAVGEATDLFAGEARRLGVKVSLELGRQLPLVRAEMIELEQVILNLLRNGAEAMSNLAPAERQILVSTRREPGGVQIDIRDNGEGLDDEAYARLFEPFFTTKPQGLGLGLSISRSIMEAFGGTLRVIRNPERGTTVQLTLPALETNNDDT